MLRSILMIGTTLMLALAPAYALTKKQKMDTCTFGANDQKLTGNARKAFIAKCMSNKDDPRGPVEKKN